MKLFLCLFVSHWALAESKIYSSRRDYVKIEELGQRELKQSVLIGKGISYLHFIANCRHVIWLNELAENSLETKKIEKKYYQH